MKRAAPVALDERQRAALTLVLERYADEGLDSGECEILRPLALDSCACTCGRSKVRCAWCTSRGLA